METAWNTFLLHKRASDNDDPLNEAIMTTPERGLFVASCETRSSHGLGDP